MQDGTIDSLVHAQLHNCPVAELHNCTVSQFHSCTITQLHIDTVAQLHNCIIAVALLGPVIVPPCSCVGEWERMSGAQSCDCYEKYNLT